MEQVSVESCGWVGRPPYPICATLQWRFRKRFLCTPVMRGIGYCCVDLNDILFPMVRTRSSSLDGGSPPLEGQPEAGGVPRNTMAQPVASVEPTTTILVAISGVADPTVQISDAS